MRMGWWWCAAGCPPRLGRSCNARWRPRPTGSITRRTTRPRSRRGSGGPTRSASSPRAPWPPTSIAAPPADRYQVVVHVDADGLDAAAEAGQSALEDGIGVPAEMSRRLACDAATVVMTHARDGTVLDVGRKTRTIPPAIRRALTARDRRCRFPGCDASHCDAHHVRHWADGGTTRLDNLLLVCRRHHRAVHEEGFTVELSDDGEARFFWPKGRPLPEVSPVPTWAGTALASTEAHLETAGLKIDSHTATPDWYGERLDLNWAITVLHPATADPVPRDVPAGIAPG